MNMNRFFVFLLVFFMATNVFSGELFKDCDEKIKDLERQISDDDKRLSEIEELKGLGEKEKQAFRIEEGMKRSEVFSFMPEPTTKTNLKNTSVYVWNMDSGRNVVMETWPIPGDVTTIGTGTSVTTMQGPSPDSLVRNIVFNGYTPSQIEKRGTVQSLYSEHENKKRQLELLKGYQTAVETDKWMYSGKTKEGRILGFTKGKPKQDKSKRYTGVGDGIVVFAYADGKTSRLSFGKFGESDQEKIKTILDYHLKFDKDNAGKKIWEVSIEKPAIEKLDTREWVSSKGTTVNAKLVRYDRESGTVTLEKQDKKTIQLNAKQLSPQDIEYLEGTK